MKKYDKKYFEDISKYSAKEKHLGNIFKATLRVPHRKVLDVGCGEGHLVRMFLDNGIEAIGMDSSKYAGSLIQNNFWLADATKPFPFFDKSFDVCISKDFFEHIKEEKIDFVYGEMQRVGRVVMAFISHKYDKPFYTHQTVKNRDWWKKKLPGCIILY